jgi:solute carrier family 15 oligopeptide transporter 1
MYFQPDQLQVVNPLLVLALIPVFDKGIYPLLAKFGFLKKPLQRLTMGGIFAGVAFVVSGLVELSLEVNIYMKV